MRTTLTAILDDQARGHPDRLLYAFYRGDGSVRESFTYAEFVRRTCFVANRLKDTGLAPGDVAVLVYPPGLDMILAFFACARIGAIPAPAPVPARSRRHPGWTRLAHIAEHTGAKHVLTTAPMLKRLQPKHTDPQSTDAFSGSADLHWVATEVFAGESEGVDECTSEVLFLQYTSGSTSLPRGVAVTHENVIHNAKVTIDHDEPIFVSWLPHFHDLGLIGGLLSGVAKGGTVHCFSPLDFMRRPSLWFRLISDQRATITAAPNAAYDYCLRADKIGDAELSGIDLRSLRIMVNCAEPVRSDTFERFAQRFSAYGLRPSAYVAGYGLAEHTLCVTTGGRRRIRPVLGDQPNERGVPNRAPLVSCGSPRSGISVRIVDPDTCRPMADRKIGEIWVDSPSKAAGYWRLAEATDQRFRAQLAYDSGGRRFLRTGDLGFFDKGELFVCGRLSDMIIVNGRNIFPNDIEALVERAMPVALAGHVVAFGARDGGPSPERPVVLIEAAEDTIDLSHLCHLIQDGFELSDGTVARVPRGTIARTSSGKVARLHCRDKWESGAVRQLEAVEFSQGGFHVGTITGLIDALAARASALGQPDASLDQLGLDSITLVNLSLQLEEVLEAHGFDSPEMKERVADLSLLQALRISDLRNGLSLIRDASPTIAAVPGLLENAAVAVRQQEGARMLADAALAIPRPCVADADGKQVLVTGGTGFLGSFIMRSLIEFTDAQITVLIRTDSPAHGLARIRRALLDTDMPSEVVSAALTSRVRIATGDISRRQFGLCDDAWNALAAGIGRIYHCAAEVDYVKSYGLLRGTNVLGTLEVIRLASERRRKELHYASTTFVHGWSAKPVVYESDADQSIADLDFGYAQSKWVAEQLVRRARSRGLPARIYRPAFVTASATGRFVEHDLTTRIIGYMIRHGLTVDAPNQVSLLPVDICARNIVAISQLPIESAPIVHMTADNYHCGTDVSSAMSALFHYRFSPVSLAEFVAHAHANTDENDPLYPLLSFLDKNVQRILRMGKKLYDSSAYRRSRAAAPLAVDHADLRATVEPIVQYLINEGLVPPTTRVADAAPDYAPVARKIGV